ncbi:hypothetical protein Pint_26985 [Pistacia integerrima]|uniref:Uncharacterized protein n=1 Tax=Pistacia integerrima TaxID=434235 RepID=A0ACC0YUL5_9ROSI|nr:hypothetical protein Pint_26985 [Pistacia integerrima]
MRNRSFIMDWSAMDVEALRSKEEKVSMLPTVEVIDKVYGSFQVGRPHRLSSPSSATWKKEKDPQENGRVDDVGARGMKSLEEIDQSFRSTMLEPIKEEYHSSQEAKQSKEVKKKYGGSKLQVMEMSKNLRGMSTKKVQGGLLKNEPILLRANMAQVEETKKKRESANMTQVEDTKKKQGRSKRMPRHKCVLM